MLSLSLSLTSDSFNMLFTKRTNHILAILMVLLEAIAMPTVAGNETKESVMFIICEFS